MAVALSVDLSWNAPYADCPSREHVLEEAGGILGGARASGSPVRIRADIDRVDESRWRAVLTVDASGTESVRHFEARSCDAVASAAALIVAVAAEGGPLPPEPAPARENPTPTSNPAPAAKPVPSPGATAPAAPLPPSSATGSRSQLGLAAGGAIDGALLPAPAGGEEVGAGWVLTSRRVRVRAVASASFFVAQSAHLTTGEGAGFQLVAVAVRGCASWRAGPFDAGPCLGMEVDTLAATGFGAHPSTSATASWPTALGSALLTWSASEHVAIYGRADLLVPVVRPIFDVTMLGPTAADAHYPVVHRPAQVTAGGGVGIELRFF